MQIVDLLTWKAEAGAQMTSLWETKDILHRSELVGLLSTADTRQQACANVANDATSARVLAVMFCHSLAETAGVSQNRARSHADSEASGCRPAAEAVVATSAGILVLERLVAVMWKDLAVQASVPFKGSDVHRKKVRVWQALSVLAAFSRVNDSILQVDGVVEQLMQPELASVKQYQETGGLQATLLCLFVTIPYMQQSSCDLHCFFSL